jgi:hypothetical protein
MSGRIRMGAAVLYLLSVIFVFVGLQYADPGWAEGGIPLILITLPWSVLMLALSFAMSQIPFLDHGINSALWAFNFLIVMVPAGANAALIAGISRVRRWFNLRNSIFAITAMVLSLVAVQVVMPKVEQDALERRRPKSVPKAAIYTGGAVGWWQFCTYDSMRRTNHCQIWNLRGIVLEDDDFVSYDNGPAVIEPQAQIDPKQGNPYMVTLQNGRILIPKSREADMRRGLDRLRRP